MKHKYGTFSQNQMVLIKQELRKSIFFLLLCVDPKTKQDFPEVNVDDAFKGILYKLGGLNSVLYEPVELVEIISLIEAAHMQLIDNNFDFKVYRKLILDAGAKVLSLQEV